MAYFSSLKHLNLEELSRMLYSNLFGVVIVFLFALLSLKLLFSTRKSKLRLPPTPPGLPILGNLHQLGTLPHRSLQAMSKKHGPVMLLKLGQIPTVVISSEQAVSEMMKDHDIIFSNRPFQVAGQVFHHGPNNMVFAPYGDYWRQLRRISALELLSLRRVRSFHYVREEEVGILIKRISQACSQGVPIPLSKFLLSLTNSISCRCILGRKYEEENGEDKFADLTKRVAVHLLEFNFGDFFPSVGWLDYCTGFIAKLKRTSREMNVFIDQAIEEHKSQIQDGDKSQIQDGDKSDKSDFIDILLKLQKDDAFGFEFTRIHLIGLLMDMIVGGTDTTFTTMEWTIAELIKNPHVMKKVQEEVRSVMGTKSKIEENDIARMEYLKCVVKETLRLHPPPLSVPRETSSCVKIANYDIPAKTRVLVNVWALHRDPEIWERAEEFIPERFQNVDSTKGQDFRYIPFGGGRRGCPGMTFGSSTSEHVLANLLHWFNWKLPSDEKWEELDMSEGFGLSSPRISPLYVVPTTYSP